jgi:hypothetical protein
VVLLPSSPAPKRPRFRRQPVQAQAVLFTTWALSTTLDTAACVLGSRAVGGLHQCHHGHRPSACGRSCSGYTNSEPVRGEKRATVRSASGPGPLSINGPQLRNSKRGFLPSRMGCAGAFLADTDTVDVDMGEAVSSVSDHNELAEQSSLEQLCSRSIEHC